MSTDDRTAQIAQACGDPGSIVKRNDGESLSRWCARAVMAVVEDADRAEIDRLRARAEVAEATLSNVNALATQWEGYGSELGSKDHQIVARAGRGIRTILAAATTAVAAAPTPEPNDCGCLTSPDRPRGPEGEDGDPSGCYCNCAATADPRCVHAEARPAADTPDPACPTCGKAREDRTPGPHAEGWGYCPESFHFRAAAATPEAGDEPDGEAVLLDQDKARETGSPDLAPEYDEDGEPIMGTLRAGWNVSFGCRMNFGPDPDGQLRVSVHVSDKARRDGVARLDTTPEHLRLLAHQLLAVADSHPAAPAAGGAGPEEGR